MTRQPIKITVEGECGSGKTTIARIVYLALRASGFDVGALVATDPKTGEHVEYRGELTQEFQGKRVALLLQREVAINLVEKNIWRRQHPEAS